MSPDLQEAYEIYETAQENLVEAISLEFPLGTSVRYIWGKGSKKEHVRHATVIDYLCDMRLLLENPVTNKRTRWDARDLERE